MFDQFWGASGFLLFLSFLFFFSWNRVNSIPQIQVAWQNLFLRLGSKWLNTRIVACMDTASQLNPKHFIPYITKGISKAN